MVGQLINAPVTRKPTGCGIQHGFTSGLYQMEELTNDEVSSGARGDVCDLRNDRLSDGNWSKLRIGGGEGEKIQRTKDRLHYLY